MSTHSVAYEWASLVKLVQKRLLLSCTVSMMAVLQTFDTRVIKKNSSSQSHRLGSHRGICQRVKLLQEGITYLEITKFASLCHPKLQMLSKDRRDDIIAHQFHADFRSSSARWSSNCVKCSGNECMHKNISLWNNLLLNWNIRQESKIVIFLEIYFMETIVSQMTLSWSISDKWGS